MYALRILFRDVFRLISKRNGLQFLFLALKLGFNRNSGRVSIAGNQISFPDSLALLWQYHDIFFLQSYSHEGADKGRILDVGGNIGLASLYFKLQFPESQVTVFEPNPELIPYLKRNLQDTDVEILEKAVWIDEGEVNFQLNESDSSQVDSIKGQVRVNTVKLSRILAKEGPIDLLKIDIEGAEVQVLLEAKLHLGKVKNLFVEYHSYLNTPQNLSLLLGCLESNNFRYFIRTEKDRDQPLLNHFLKNESTMDMRLNIYAYQKE